MILIRRLVTEDQKSEKAVSQPKLPSVLIEDTNPRWLGLLTFTNLWNGSSAPFQLHRS